MFHMEREGYVSWETENGWGGNRPAVTNSLY